MTPSVQLLRTFDPRLCRAASHWARRRGIHRFFGVISRLGDGWFWYGLMAVLAAFGGMRGIVAALQMLGTGLVAWLLYRTLKLHTRRPRPFHAHPDVTARAAALDEYSFPSGHTLHAVSFTIVAVAWFPFLALPLIAFTVLVAMSRVVLGLHYPTDVLAGVLIGTALGAASVWSCSVSPLAMA
ncbi:MAG: phosphatase PAP2 family protein [Xanthomonadaceae bacterium]|nr:phosphatase PAP2 family protein [Xanthomonadaceae bacterium]MBU6476474.1 phosphatase PAP2 family protein [Xanthomonadaceae bacterium]MDE2054356.1 phosphatase PAP2 family protein [Xanthomonadaceae bacterium]MDE2224818.1 phosphatase PAP2 family protein [Xanthomonadaceae bacterium]MDE2497964.1 phosphatase PAP2 family protein [Xanthomonadaceae bacterium]